MILVRILVRIARILVSSLVSILVRLLASILGRILVSILILVRAGSSDLSPGGAGEKPQAPSLERQQRRQPSPLEG